ncbi:hypothetical protein J6590_033651 [Homalodisca vitripennis]|nr:hypothetical protein J6590_033651 [Homalodisca vitripennis]
MAKWLYTARYGGVVSGCGCHYKVLKVPVIRYSLEYEYFYVHNRRTTLYRSTYRSDVEVTPTTYYPMSYFLSF